MWFVLYYLHAELKVGSQRLANILNNSLYSRWSRKTTHTFLKCEFYVTTWCVRFHRDWSDTDVEQQVVITCTRPAGFLIHNAALLLTGQQ